MLPWASLFLLSSYIFFFWGGKLLKLCYHPSWRLMRTEYCTCFHTLYEGKEKCFFGHLYFYYLHTSLKKKGSFHRTYTLLIQYLYTHQIYASLLFGWLVVGRFYDMSTFFMICLLCLLGHLSFYYLLTSINKKKLSLHRTYTLLILYIHIKIMSDGWFYNMSTLVGLLMQKSI